MTNLFAFQAGKFNSGYLYGPLLLFRIRKNKESLLNLYLIQLYPALGRTDGASQTTICYQVQTSE